MKKKSRSKKLRGSSRVLKLSSLADTKLKFWATLAGHREFMGLLLGKRCREHDLVEDVVLMHGQSISSGSVVVSPGGMRDTHKEIREKFTGKGLELMGWCHSHGSMNSFQSSVDDENTRDMLRHIGTAYLYVKKKDGSVVHWPASAEDIDKAGTVSKEDIEEYLGFCYTLTINNDFEICCERWLQHVCPHCDRIIESTKAEVQVEEPHKTLCDLSILKDQFETRTSVRYYATSSGYRDDRDESDYDTGDSGNGKSRCQVIRITQEEISSSEDMSCNNASHRTDLTDITGSSQGSGSGDGDNEQFS
jgi:hypothetical protein